MNKESSTDLSTVAPQGILHGYKDVVFGRGYLKDKFKHGTGLFFPELTKRSSSSEVEDGVACTFAFTVEAGDPSLKERTAYLRGKLIEHGAKPYRINTFQERGRGDVLNQASGHDGFEKHPRQIIEFKFSKADEDVARQAILKIDAMAGGRISRKLGLY